MAIENPVSPKLYGGALVGAAAPILLLIIETVTDLVSSGAIQIPEQYQAIVYTVVTLLGAIIGVYTKKDGLRLTTIDSAAVKALPNGEQLVATAADALNAPVE